FSPFKPFMAVHIFLKTGFQCFEQVFALFCRQLIFIASDVVHAFTSSASAYFSIVARGLPMDKDLKVAQRALQTRPATATAGPWAVIKQRRILFLPRMRRYP